MYAQMIYETPEEWGSETVYADAAIMEEVIASLIDAGGEDWSGIGLDDCSEWRFEGVPDLAQPGVFVYGNFESRYPKFARFTADDGHYTAIEFFPTLESANEVLA